MRKIKYTTKEQKIEANKRNCAKYYAKNQEKLRKKRMKRYWKDKNG